RDGLAELDRDRAVAGRGERGLAAVAGGGAVLEDVVGGQTVGVDVAVEDDRGEGRVGRAGGRDARHGGGGKGAGGERHDGGREEREQDGEQAWRRGAGGVWARLGACVHTSYIPGWPVKSRREGQGR